MNQSQFLEWEITWLPRILMTQLVMASTVVLAMSVRMQLGGNENRGEFSFSRVWAFLCTLPLLVGLSVGTYFLAAWSPTLSWQDRRTQALVVVLSCGTMAFLGAAIMGTVILPLVKRAVLRLRNLRLHRKKRKNDRHT